MPSDPNRVAFVQRDRRFFEASDPAVKVTYTGAGEITHETSFNAASATALATTYFNLVKNFGQAYSVEIEGSFSIDELAGSPPQFTVSFPQYATDARTFKLVAVESDDFHNRTKLVIRG